MTPIKDGRMQRFIGIDITLHFKKGTSAKIGDGLVITDGEKVHIWTGKQTDGKNFLIPAEPVKELDVKKLEKATYRNKNNGNFETFRF